jgi:hypothetical protein
MRCPKGPETADFPPDTIPDPRRGPGRPPSTAASTVVVTSEDRHGVIVGTFAIRFSKHDAPVYSYVGRIVHDTITINIPAHNSSINGTVNTRNATITGTANGQSGVFSLKLLTP